MYRTRVLHMIDTLSVGGAEKLVVGIVNSIPEVEHHIIYLAGSDALLKYLPSNCKVTRLNFRSRFDIPRCILKVNGYIKKNRIQVIHTHLFMSTFIARLAAPSNVRIFTTIHNLSSKNYFARSKTVKFLEKTTYRKQHHIIAICHEVLADYENCVGVKGPYSVLYNFVDDVFHRNDYKRLKDKKNLKLVAVGNLKKGKNYSYLIEAFKQMPPEVSLDIYGSGALKDELQQAIDTFQLNIKLCGNQENIQTILPAYDAFVMSSVFEGQPLALLEAMASGLPAILSDIAVLREVVNNEAVFFDLDNPADFVYKIKEIQSGRIDLDSVANAGFKRVKEIALKENYMRRLYKIYTSTGVYRKETFEPILSTPVFRNIPVGLNAISVEKNYGTLS